MTNAILRTASRAHWRHNRTGHALPRAANGNEPMDPYFTAAADDLANFEARQLALDGFTSSGSSRTPDGRERVSPLAPAFSENSFHTREVR